jgi:non-homologous end joining protein Ku
LPVKIFPLPDDFPGPGGQAILLDLDKEEIQGIEKIEEPVGMEKMTVDNNSLNLAKTLIQNMSGDFKADQYKDEYTQTLLGIIKAKPTCPFA